MPTSRWAALVLIVVLGAAGCGDDGDGDGGNDDAGSTTTERDPSTIEVRDTSLGDVLTDGNGLTLYLFTMDTAAKSACEGDCLAAWPPVEGKPAAGDGADSSLIGTAEGPGGIQQATYDGHRLYYYASDKAAGDVTGQGVNDVWWVVDATGAMVEESPSEPPEPGY